MAVTPPLVDAYGLQMAMAIFAGVSFVCTALFFIFVHSNPKGQSQTENQIQYKFIEGFKSLIGNKNLNILFAIAFLGLGYFNGLTTWLELILAPQGINAVDAGIIGGILILGGIVGAGIVPAISDKIQKRKGLLILCLIFTAITLLPFCQNKNLTSVYILAALQGFTFLPAFSLVLEMCAEVVDSKTAGFATSIIMLGGNAGGVVVIMAMDWIRAGHETFKPAVYLLNAVIVVCLVLAFLMPETYRKKV